MMQYKQLGRTGLRVSAVGLGGNIFGPAAPNAHRIDAAETARVINRALDLGINHVDTADVYSRGVSEDYVGQALASRRHEMVVATKFWGKMGDGPNDHGSSRGHLMQAVEASLRRLKTDYIDLYYVHSVDPTTPLDETMRTLDDLVSQGKVRYPACSNFPGWLIVQSAWVADKRGYTPFAVVQSQYNLLERGLENEVIPACRAAGVGVVPWYPLVGGILTGKYKRGQAAPPDTRGHNNPNFAKLLSDRNLDIVEKLSALAEQRGHTVAELAIAWLIAQPDVSSVIAGATSPEQVEANARAAEWQLSTEDLAAIDAITKAS